MTDKKMCLCGLLGAESDSLPEKVREEVKRFFTQNLTWLSAAHSVNGEINPQKAAIQTISMLEGAMMISKTLDDHSYFDLATRDSI